MLQRILAKVNGDIITQTDLENRQVAALRQENFVPTSDEVLRRKLVEVTPRVISNAVDELLLVQRGRVLGYYLSDEQYAEMVASIMEENGFESDEDFEEALLQAEGMTVTDFRRSMEHRILVNQVQQIEILRKVMLTETEAREYYNANLDQFAEEPTVTLREILIAVPETSASFNVGTDDLARAAAEEARQRVVDGEDFGVVAIAVSDAPSKANGGLIGPLDYAILSETVQQVLDGLEVGDMSAPIRTSGRLPGAAARGAHGGQSPPVRRGQEQHHGQRVQRPPLGGVQPLPRATARRGRHRVEGRRVAARLRAVRAAAGLAAPRQQQLTPRGLAATQSE